MKVCGNLPQRLMPYCCEHGTGYRHYSAASWLAAMRPATTTTHLFFSFVFTTHRRRYYNNSILALTATYFLTRGNSQRTDILLFYYTHRAAWEGLGMDRDRRKGLERGVVPSTQHPSTPCGHMICTWRQLALLGCVETVVLLLGFDFARDMRVVFFYLGIERREGTLRHGKRWLISIPGRSGLLILCEGKVMG